MRRVHGYHVLILEDDQNLRAKLKLPRSLLYRRPKVILFLDDLHRSIGRFSPNTLLKGLLKQSRHLVIISTCRSGEERSALLRDDLFAPFTIQNFTEIKVEELSKSEEKTLASHFNRHWSDAMYNGTPASIAFGLDVLREQIRTVPEPAKALMRSMSVMNSQGIETFRTFRPSRIIGPKENAPEVDYSPFYRKPAPRSEIPPLVAEVSLSFMASLCTRRTEFLIVLYFPFCVRCPSDVNVGNFSASKQSEE